MVGPVWKRINVLSPWVVKGLDVVGNEQSGPEKLGQCHLYAECIDYCITKNVCCISTIIF